MAEYIQKAPECRQANCYAQCCMADYYFYKRRFKRNAKNCPQYEEGPKALVPDVSLQRYIHISKDGNIEIREAEGWKMNIKADGDIEFFDKDGKRTMVVFG